MAIYLGTNKLSLAGTNGGYMMNGRLIATKTYSFNLGQTNFSSITPTTSTQSITLPTTTYTTTASTTITCFRLGENYDGTVINYDEHDYVVFQYYVINYNYGSNNVNSTIHGIRGTGARDLHFGKYPTLNSSTGQRSGNIQKSNSYISSVTPLLYQKADNTYAIATSQGIYGGTTPASISTSNNKNYMDLKFGSLYVKYNDSYCPLASLQALNPSNTTVTITWEVYEGDKSMYSNIYDTAYSLVMNQ